jgi:hypothetical protein
MRRIFAIIKALIYGRVSIEFVDKIRVSKTPGDLTELTHN